MEAISYLKTNVVIFKSKEMLYKQTTRWWWKWWRHHKRSFLQKKRCISLLYKIKYKRTVLYCGGAEAAIGVPNSASSFGILSLQRLTLAVIGTDDDDDGSAKRIRRRS